MTRLLKLLNIKHPIIEAPMAGSNTARLVAAACNAGVLGSLGAQYMTPAEMRTTIAEIRGLTDRPFAINLFSLPAMQPPSATSIANALAPLAPYYAKFSVPTPTIESVLKGIDPEEQFRVIIEEKVPVFSFTMGICPNYQLQALKDNSIVSVGTATNVKEALALERAGVDAVSVQGCEAGGHRGTFIGSCEDSMIGLMALIPQVVDAVKIPVIAAGGIMDGRGMAAALALGADGVQMGTAFLTVIECAVHPHYKKAIQEQNVEDTTITDVFSGGKARGIKNKFISENQGQPILPFPYHNALTRPFRSAANKTGEIDYTNLWSGQAGALAKETSVQVLVDKLIKDLQVRLQQLEFNFGAKGSAGDEPMH